MTLLVPRVAKWAILIGQFLGYVLLANLAVRWLERSARDQGLHYL